MVEDQTRLLAATERVTHTILAINAGAFLILLILNIPEWYAHNTGFSWAPHGWLSVFLMLCGIGVALSGLRDGLASMQLFKQAQGEQEGSKLSFNSHSDHVFITGGTGFVGRRLVAAVLADGHSVTLLTRNAKAAAWLFAGKVQCVEAMHELDQPKHVDVIVNLAGARILAWRWTKKCQQILRDSRVKLTASVVEWIAQCENKPRLLLSASAIGYYGIQAENDDSVLTEDSPSQDIFMSQLCQDWEASAAKAAD